MLYYICTYYVVPQKQKLRPCTVTIQNNYEYKCSTMYYVTTIIFMVVKEIPTALLSKKEFLICSIKYFEVCAQDTDRYFRQAHLFFFPWLSLKQTWIGRFSCIDLHFFLIFFIKVAPATILPRPRLMYLMLSP